MPQAYKTGTKCEVMQNMAACAIRDQQALIDALLSDSSEPDQETKRHIEECEKWISDFRRIYKLYE